MSEERKPEVEESEEHGETYGCGHGWHRPGHCGHRGGWGHHAGGHLYRRMMMRFASMTVEEEVEFLESVKAHLEERLAAIDEKLERLRK